MAGLKRLGRFLPLLLAGLLFALPVAAADTQHVDSAVSAMIVGQDGQHSLPVAVALSDALANPTTTEVGANNLIWDGAGSSWVRSYSARSIGDGGAGFGLPAVNPYLYNGGGNNTGYDHQYNNVTGNSVGITCAACTSTQTGADQTNYNGRGVQCVYDATVVTGSGSFTVEIDGKDSVSGKYYALLTGTARSTTGTDVLTVYPGAAVTANASASTRVPRTWRVKATYNSGTNQTFTIGCSTGL